MVAADTERMEVNSPATTNTRTNNNNAASAVNNINAENDVNFPVPSLGRQSSIYSLTLDEFQNTLCEGGKNFGSMNMDEFLNSIWSAEENQNHPQNATAVSTTLAALNPLPPVSAGGRGLGIARQSSLSRQGSLSVPGALCLKTVEEVWSEIHRGGGHNQSSGPEARPAQQRQHTFGDMTLEDFLVKAGVVRDAGLAAPPHPPPPPTPAVAAPQFGMYQNGGNHLQMGHTFGPTAVPIMTVPGGPGLGSSTKINNGYVPVPVPIVGPTAGMCYGNGGGGGYGAGLGMASPVSPLGSEGMGDGMDVGALRARKRTLDGPVEKVVERRQRRMIKNRESAARSRARKQAYTVELEAELNQLREENTQLKQALCQQRAELERQQDQQRVEEQCVEEQQKAPQSRAHKARDRLGLIRRIKSCQM